MPSVRRSHQQRRRRRMAFIPISVQEIFVSCGVRDKQGIPRNDDVFRRYRAKVRCRRLLFFKPRKTPQRCNALHVAGDGDNDDSDE